MTQYHPFLGGYCLKHHRNYSAVAVVVNRCKCLGSSHINVRIFAAQRKLITVSSESHQFKKTKDHVRQPYYLSTYLEASREFAPQVSSPYSH